MDLMEGSIRPAAVAGSWYPRTASGIADAVDACLDAVQSRPPAGRLVALIAPHAGLVYSGPVAAHAYALLQQHAFDVIVLVGPSHFVGFEGVALFPDGAFDTPLGPASVDAECADAIRRATSVVQVKPAPHGREHSLEMQLPFIRRLAPSSAIVPLLVGYQTAQTAKALGDGLAAALAGRNALLVASSDLSHYHDAVEAGRLDATVIACVARFDPDALQEALGRLPDHACGGGPMVAVMRAARALGATGARVLRYADSGDVSGDKSSVVGYLAAAFGTFDVEG